MHKIEVLEYQLNHEVDDWIRCTVGTNDDLFHEVLHEDGNVNAEVGHEYIIGRVVVDHIELYLVYLVYAEILVLALHGVGLI